VLVARGRDGQPRIERFHEAGQYKRRLLALTQSTGGGFSIDELVDLLDA
jgi:hypothetical protein